MKCVFTVNTYEHNTLASTELWTEDKRGTTAPLIPLTKDIRTWLVVTPAGFVVRNVRGEVLRQGDLTDVFDIYDSMLFRPDPLHVTAPGYTGTFSDYERAYGHGRIIRDTARKYLVYAERTAEGVGVGLTHYDRFDTLAIYSLWLVGEVTNKDLTDHIAEFVAGQLQACEYGAIYGIGLAPSELSGHYAGMVGVKTIPYAPRLEQPLLLAADAIKRRADTAEVLTAPVRYQPMEVIRCF